MTAMPIPVTRKRIVALALIALTTLDSPISTSPADRLRFPCLRARTRVS